MFTRDQYSLLDFGNGRRLERFGPRVLDRPCPAAAGSAKSEPGAWKAVQARYETSPRGRSPTSPGWRIFEPEAAAEPLWRIQAAPLTFELDLSPSGQVGLFPDHAEHWRWIDKCVRELDGATRVLNLFAYTGGATLAAAAAGAEVTHVDAARGIVSRARRNAELSGLAEAPIRWIAEDAQRYVAREIRRGREYEGLILDPPSYGHGPKGESWKIDRDLEELLAACGELLAPQCAFVLLTSHTPAYDAARLAGMLNRLLPHSGQGRLEQGPMSLTTAAGEGKSRRLTLGCFARWSRERR